MLHKALDEETENVRRINQVLGTNLGFEDDELARTLYIIAEQSSNPYEMMTAIESEQLRMYYIPTEVMYQIWTVVCQPRRYSPMGGVNIWHKDCYARQDKHNIPVMRMRRRL
ncbi:unnamed protein product [Dicrocoelium dendriticum]|nr:unnamed protein product [Dicrocoelium dendriticum]